jgi:Branched-chain polyamine synthase A C-terminal domain
MHVPEPSVLLEALGHRPVENHSLEQFLMRPSDVMTQAIFIDGHMSLLGSTRLALIGDDDHVSVVLACKNPEYNITVLEYDERIIQSIGAMCLEFGVKPPTCIPYDVREPIPRHLYNSADVFYVNPPYSKKHPTNKGLGIKAWLDRARVLCGPNKLGIIAMPWEISPGSNGWEKEVRESVQEYLREKEYQQLTVEVNCASYPNARDPGLKSSNLVVKTPSSERIPNRKKSRIYN